MPFTKIDILWKSVILLSNSKKDLNYIHLCENAPSSLEKALDCEEKTRLHIKEKALEFESDLDAKEKKKERNYIYKKWFKAIWKAFTLSHINQFLKDTRFHSFVSCEGLCWLKLEFFAHCNILSFIKLFYGSLPSLNMMVKLCSFWMMVG